MDDLAITVARSDQDWLDWLSVHNRIWPYLAMTPEEFAHERSMVDEDKQRQWIVRAGGEAVAVAAAERQVWAPTSRRLYCLVLVDPGWRRRGIGTKLVSLVSDFARELEFEGLRGMAFADDTEAVGYFERRGFQQVEMLVDVALDLRDYVPAEPVLPDGFRVETLESRPDLIREYYDVLAEAVQDVPGDEQTHPPPFDEWERMITTSPGYRTEAAFMAIASETGGEQVVAVAELEFQLARQDIAWHGFTAVKRAFRGRGLARALKLHTIRYAKGAGLAALQTENEERNSPMRHINISLGYTPLPARIMLRGPLQ